MAFLCSRRRRHKIDKNEERREGREGGDVDRKEEKKRPGLGVEEETLTGEEEEKRWRSEIVADKGREEGRRRRG